MSRRDAVRAGWLTTTQFAQLSILRKGAGIARRRARGLLLWILGDGKQYSGSASKSHRPQDDPVALVEEFTKERISGWIAVKEGSEPIRVALFLNKYEVAATWVTYTPPTRRAPEQRSAVGEIWPFQLRLRDVWKYAKCDDRLSVRIGNRRIPICGSGTVKHPDRDGVYRPIDLKSKMDEDYIFSQSGVLQLAKRSDEKWQRKVAWLYREVREVLKSEFGNDVFLIYGTLLGAVREGNYIGHDVDFDAAYLSGLKRPEEVVLERHRVARVLIDHGLDVCPKKTALHIYKPDDASARIDLFHLYFDSADELCMPFGVAGTSSFHRDQWAGIEEIELNGESMGVPAAAESIVEHVYGDGWREPKPGFNWPRDRTRLVGAGFVPSYLIEDSYWNNFYRHKEDCNGSAFSQDLIQRGDLPGYVADIGCGDGRDSRAFARAGKRVVGLDRSEVGIRRATEIGKEEGLASRLGFVVCDVSTDSLDAVLGDVLESCGVNPALFYLRFVLNSLDESAGHSLIRRVAKRARSGDFLAAEFRIKQDEKSKKVHRQHYRRFLSGAEFIDGLRDGYGFTIVSEITGRGLSPYKGEDPDLCRVIARKSGA
jgi:SAM-dependent methyltransferase